MVEAIIFTGLQGSGKTTYFNDHFGGTRAHISRDVLRTAHCQGAPNRRLPPLGPLVCRGQYQRDAHDTCTNNHRKDKAPIPVPAILRTAKQLEPPSLDEGFHEITPPSH